MKNPLSLEPKTRELNQSRVWEEAVAPSLLCVSRLYSAWTGSVEPTFFCLMVDSSMPVGHVISWNCSITKKDLRIVAADCRC